MDYEVDLEPAHAVIRLAITAEIITPELAKDIDIHLAQVLSSSGPFALIVDVSRVTSWTEPAATIRERALRDPAVPGGRTPRGCCRRAIGIRRGSYLPAMAGFPGRTMSGRLFIRGSLRSGRSAPRSLTRRVFPMDLAA